MSVKERLKEFIKYSRLSQRTFEQSIGLSNGYVSNIVNTISPKVQDKIRYEYPELNISWLLTGDGNMIKRGGHSVECLFEDVPNAVMVPFVSKYDYQKYAEYHNFHNDTEIHLGLMAYPFIIPQFKHYDARFFAIEVIDNSLDDGSARSILKDDVILCRSIILDLIYTIDFSSPLSYSVIIHKGQISMGAIQIHDLNNQYMRITSPNKKHPPIDIPFKEINGLYDIVQLVRHV